MSGGGSATCIHVNTLCTTAVLTISLILAAVGLPTEPWNWVSFFPHPTVIGFAVKETIDTFYKHEYTCNHFVSQG